MGRRGRLVALVALARWRGAAATSCVADGSTNHAQMAPQATWECCADDVEKIEYEARVPSGFDDPVRWVARDDPVSYTHLTLPTILLV